MQMRLLLVLAVLSLAVLGATGGEATHGGSHTCALNEEQAGTNPVTNGTWAFDFRLVNDTGANTTQYDTPSPSITLKAVCLYTVNGDEFLVKFDGPGNHVTPDGCYTVKFYEPGNSDGLWLSRTGAQPPCEQLSYFDAMVGGSFTIKQGDFNCDAAVNSVDALHVLRHSSGLEVFQTEPCPFPGMTWYGGKKFVDVDCSGAVNSVDSLKILRHVSGLSVSQTEPCPDIGTNLPTS